MALVLKSKIEEESDATGFKIWDTTGMFHPTYNTGGWEGQNPLLSSITNANALVTLPNLDTLLPTGDPKIINIHSKLPNVAGDYFNMLATLLGYTDGKLPDGYYDITLRYGTASANVFYTFRTKQIFFTRAACCIENLGAEITLETCDKNSQKYRDWTEGTFALEILKDAILCGNINRSIEWLKRLQAICTRNPCKTC